jgi:hypothetical protein
MLLPALLGVYDVTKKGPICEDRFFLLHKENMRN